MTEQVVASVDDCLSMHDFRVVKGYTHSNLIFDLVIPYQCQKSEDQIIKEINEKIKENNPSLNTVITIDRSYI